MYKYEDYRAQVLESDKIPELFKTYKAVVGATESTGCIAAYKLMDGDSWKSFGRLDYLVEIGMIRELTDDSVMGQDRVFAAK